MPFRSDAQRKFMYAKHPEIAERWQNETKGKLPKRVGLSDVAKKPSKKGASLSSAGK